MSQRKRKYREYLKSSEKEVPMRSLRRYNNEDMRMTEEDLSSEEGDFLECLSKLLGSH